MADPMNNDGKGDPSSSDDDSISLLHNLHVVQDNGVDETLNGTDLRSNVANKDVTKLDGIEISPFQATQTVMSGWTEPTSECVGSLSTPVKPTRSMTNLKRLHKRSGMGETLLHKACKRGDLARVRALIQAGINVNIEDFTGWTPLHEACLIGDETVVEELLKSGADVNALGGHGVTPLHDAVCAGHYEVVALLLQRGAFVDIRNLAGLTAVDMAEEDNMKELLRTFQRGTTPSVRHCGTLLDCRATTHLQSRAANYSERARKPNDGQPGKRHTFLDTWSHCEAVKSVLKEVEKKHNEVSIWPLADLRDGERCHTALITTHNMLSEVLSRQRWEKDQLSQKYHSNTLDWRQQRVFRLQLLSLASCQKELMEMLCRQQRLVQTHTVKATSSTQPSRQQGGMLQAGPPHTEKHRKKCRGRLSTSQPGTTETRTRRSRSKVKGQEAAIHAGDVARLMQRGVTPAGSLLQVWLKGRWHYARIQTDGSIESDAKIHRTPELWLQAILGKNIPVSSSYVRNKIRFKDRPLSCYLENIEREGQEEVRSASGSELQGAAPTEAAGSSDWKKIKTICLVGDNGWLPNVVVDWYWNQLVHRDHLEEEH